MKTRALQIILFLLLLGNTSCRKSDSPTIGPLSEERFRTVYIALLDQGEKPTAFPPDSTGHSRADSIFRAFGTSANEFRQTAESFRTDPRRWQEFYEGVVKSLEMRQQQRNTAKQG